jgi:hypothetical protein
LEPDDQEGRLIQRAREFAVAEVQRDINADKEGELSLVPQTAEAPAPRRRTRRS